jgi:hypothetical protein
MPTQNKSKEKRNIPIREVGKPIDQKQLRPSQILFRQAKEEIDRENLGHTHLEISDTRDFQSRTHEVKKLGHTDLRISDTKTPEITTRAPEKKPISDTKTPEIENSDTRDFNKINRKSYDLTYEQKRKVETSRDRMNLRPNIEIGRKIRIFCAENGLELSEFFEICAVTYIENLGHPRKKISDTKTPIDDRRLMISWKTKGHIINLYLRYNVFFNAKSRWSVSDDEKGSKFNDLDFRVIELGIIQTQFQKNFKGKINSFGYYENEINNFAELGMNEEVLNTMLKINRQRWQQATGKIIDYSEFEIKAETAEN